MGLKIALVTSWHVRCGIASYSLNLARSLVAKDAEIYIIRVPRFGEKTSETATAIARKIPYDDVDIIHLQHEYGLWREQELHFFNEIKRHKVPIVTTMHSIGQWKMDPIIYTGSDKIVVHNEFCSKRLGHPNVIIPHGAKPEYNLPPPEEAKQSLGIAEDVPIVGYCGYISEYKGVDLLVETMKKIPDAALLVAGGWFSEEPNTYIANLQREAVSALKGRCRFTGYVSDSDLARTYAAMDVFVYPSRYATESGALITALSHGRAVIASNLAPFREKQKYKALIIFKDLKDLRRKIMQLLKHKDKRMTLQKAAMKYAEQTSWPKIADLHLSLYDNIIEEQKT